VLWIKNVYFIHEWDDKCTLEANFVFAKFDLSTLFRTFCTLPGGINIEKIFFSKSVKGSFLAKLYPYYVHNISDRSDVVFSYRRVS